MTHLKRGVFSVFQAGNGDDDDAVGAAIDIAADTNQHHLEGWRGHLGGVNLVFECAEGACPFFNQVVASELDFDESIIDGWRVLMMERNTSFTVGSTQNVRFAPAGIIDREGPETVWDNNVEVPEKFYINGLLLFPDDFSANDWTTNVTTLAGKVVNNPPSSYPNRNNTNNCLTLK